MSPWKALLYVLVASAVYYPALVGLGWLLGLGVEQAASLATWAGVAATALVLIGVGVAVWRMWQKIQGSNGHSGQ
jgi:membrane protein DedA with SNARE-associated domain